MLTLFRNFFKSKIGIVLTLAFLGLIALAFASADITATGQFGGVAGGDRVAMVGDDKIGTAELANAATTALERLKQQQPTMTMPVFLAAGGLDRVLDDVIDRYAVAGFGRQIGLRAGDRLVDSEIASIPAFTGPDGKFSSDLFRQAIRQQGLSEQQVRSEIAQSLYARQVLAPVSYQPSVPAGIASQYAALLRESRSGAVAMLPSTAFLPSARPTANEVQTYYATHRDAYIRPERRVIRYATFGEGALKTPPKPTEAEIAARYKRDAAKYAPSETRNLTQVVASSESQAKAIHAAVAAGQSLSAVAAAQGLATAKLSSVAKPQLAEAASDGVANAAFAARDGQVTAPTRGGLGWYVLQVDAITRKAGRSLDQARAEITTELSEEKRRAAVADLSAEIEDQVDSGASLADLAKQLGVTVETTKPLTADGEVYGEDATAPAVLGRALSSAFAMEEGEPQLAEIEPGKTFLIYDVSSITPSAPAPLAEIRQEVERAAWLAEGAREARAAADRVLARVRKGASLADALATEKKPLPPVDNLALSRQELAQMGERIPAPIALFFAMSQGTVKKLEGDNNAGWFVVQLKTVTPGKVAGNDAIVAAARRELAPTVGNEYETQFRAAVRAELGVERNKTAVDAVRRRLTGEN